MLKIIEKKIMNSSYYVVETWKRRRLFKSKTIFLKSKKGYVNNRLYYIFYDSNNNIVKPVWEYLNLNKGFLNESTKDNIISSIKTLYYFAECLDLNIANLTRKEALEYLDFLAGHSIIGYDISLYLQTERDTYTITRIIGYASDFLRSQGYKKSSEALKGILKSKSINSHTSKGMVITRCDYISETQFNDILHQIKNRKEMKEMNRLKYKIIFILMYVYGMRIGEVLGMTLEDIFDDTTLKGARVGRIILRNRINENQHRKAKTCFTPVDKNDYHLYRYKKNELRSLTNSGFQIVTIAYEVFELIQQYIAEAHTYFYTTNGYKKSIADCIDLDTDFENHYLFLNDTLGSPLSYYRMNELAKELMTNAGVKPDKSSKKENWCHKCRHGFVIKKLYIEHMRAEDVIQLTRHTTVMGLQPYLRMTPDDISYYCEDFAEYRRTH